MAGRPGRPGGTYAEELIRKVLAAYRLNAIRTLMARQRALHLRRIRGLEPDVQTLGSNELAPVLLVDHARFHLDSDLRWLEVAAERIRRRPAPALPSATPTEALKQAVPVSPTKPLELSETSDGKART